MGVALEALTVLAVLVGGALLTAWFESRVPRRNPEQGPASPIGLRPDVSPPMADRWLYPAAPITAFFGVAVATVVLPFGPGLIGADLGIALFYFIVVVDFVVLGLALGGWGPIPGMRWRSTTVLWRSSWPMWFLWDWPTSGRS